MILKEKKSSIKTRGYKSLLSKRKKSSTKTRGYKLLLLLEKNSIYTVYTVEQKTKSNKFNNLYSVRNVEPIAYTVEVCAYSVEVCAYSVEPIAYTV